MISKLTAITPEYMKHRIEEETEQYKQEIERLTKQNKALNEVYELTKKEYIRLNNIIKEAREYADKMLESYDSKGLLEILDKEKNNEQR